MYRIRVIAREAKTSRIGALSDGLFAIVMTLLVIELAVPEVPKLLAAEQLHLKLLELWPKFAAYALSFIMLGILWSYHHIMFQHIRRVDGRVIWLNIFYLMFVALFPFSTAVIGEYTIFATAAVVLWGANGFLIMLVMNILLRYVLRNKRLINKDISPMEIMQLKINAGASTVLILVAIGLSFIIPYIGIAIYILLMLWAIVTLIASETYHPDGEKK